MRAPAELRQEERIELDRSDPWFDNAGPQGAALVKELRRIQKAFDRQFGDTDVEALPGAPRDRYATTRRAQKRGNGTRRGGRGLTSALKACLPRLRSMAVVEDDGIVRNLARQAEATPARRSARGYAQVLRKDRQAEITVESPPLQYRGDEPNPSALSLSVKTLGTRAAETCLSYAKLAYDFFVGRRPVTHPQDLTDGQLERNIERSFGDELRIGLRMLVVAGALVGGWGTLVPLSGAVVVMGALVAETNVKKVQHPTGGVVAQIYVHNGMHVHEGDLLLRLDEVQARANLQLVAQQLDQVRVRIARLVAERDGLKEPEFPRGSVALGADGQMALVVASERTLFKARTDSRQSQKELLRKQISQLNDQVTGLDAQLKAKVTQRDLIDKELTGIQTLYDKQLVTLTRLTTLQREAARLDGERGQLVSSMAETQSKISEAELQIVRNDQDFRTELMKELRQSQDKEAELSERNVAARDLLDRVEIRAPTFGIVHQLSAHTIGGVIAAGEAIMEIVPDTDDLQIEARLPPKDIDHVRVGQTSLIRFSAFNQRTTPELKAVVSYVSADATHDAQSNTTYYTVRVSFSNEERRRLGPLQLVSGMPAEVFFQTGSRSMMSYLLKPVTDQLERTFSAP